jgi:hypothetical protein
MSSSSDSSIEKVNEHREKEMQTQQDSKATTPDVEMAEKTPSQTDAQSASLPPVDRGHQAWLFLAGCYVMEALVFGTPLNHSHGVPH